MILSVSRRTDIPAFYMDWFMARYNEGYILTVNPMNRKQVSRINFEDVDALVFWTKNPKYLLQHAHKMSQEILVHVTITPYTKEEDIVSKVDVIADTIKLSQVLTRRVIWRYDPIMINAKYDTAYHLKYFEKLCQSLEGHIDRCVISFLEPYKKINHILKDYDLPDQDFKVELVGHLNRIAQAYGIELVSCCNDLGINSRPCIDGERLNIPYYKKDPYQREACQCLESVDVGAYNTCIHACVYCYANYNHQKAMDFFSSFDCNQKHLGPKLLGDETIKVRHIKKKMQVSLFDKEIIK